MLLDPAPLAGRSAFQPVGHDFDALDLPSLALDPFPRYDLAADLAPPRDDALLEPRGAQPRPLSPASVEKVASMMRSLAFTATSPHADSEEHQRREWAKVSRALMRDVRSEPLARMRASDARLADRTQSVLAFACGAMLGVEVPDGALAAVGEELGQLRHHLPTPLFPGGYYEEIFEADVAQLSAACASRRHAVTRKMAAERDVWAALAAPVHSAAELDGAAAQADAAGLVAPGVGARAVSALVVRAAVRDTALAGAEAHVAQLRAELAGATKRLGEAEAQLTAAAKTRVALEASVRDAHERARAETDARAKAEADAARAAAGAQEEASRRWAAERELHAVEAARAELQAALTRAEAARAALDGELRDARRLHDAALVEERAARADAERARAHAEARADGEERARARVDEELAGAREAHAEAARLLGEARAALDKEKDARRDAEQRAFREGDLKLRAHERLATLDGELAAKRGRLAVANDAMLRRALELNAAEEALRAALRAREGERSRIADLEARLAAESERARVAMGSQADAVKAADATAVELRRRLYDLQSQLTDATRRREDAAVAQAHAEAQLRAALQLPRAVGANVSAIGAVAHGPGSAAAGAGVPAAASSAAASSGTLVSQLTEQLKAEAAKRQQLERIALGLQADLVAVTAAAARRAGERAVEGGRGGDDDRGGKVGGGRGGDDGADGARQGARRAPNVPAVDAAAAAPRPPPTLAARRVPSGVQLASGAPAGKAGNARPGARAPADAERVDAAAAPFADARALGLTRGAAYASGGGVGALDEDDELWSFAAGAVARSGGALGATRPAAGGAGEAAAGEPPLLPRIGSPFSCAQRSYY
ncbi:hypothetical protein KFE25_004165 [Diacronema lutheri]|uniref:Uncharacterized protein n=1 Tax=Diacronema lutheri TaxID=2081491 RepID=A0A8J5X4G2_DIALT|nr:hypothetical protein KFE25_004165 [Diacronema lutheri]